MAARSGELPAWVNLGLLPLLNLAAAFFVSGLVVVFIGEDPLEVVAHPGLGLVRLPGGDRLHPLLPTNFIFTGLAVAIAFHCMLFNIGGEGQAYVGGLGITRSAIHLGFLPPILLVSPLCIVGAGLFGAAWAFIPAYLQAKRGSHVVITTIMFNFIASSLMGRRLVSAPTPPRDMHRA